MIRYKYNGGYHFFVRLLQTKGSVFPRSMFVALPCGLIAVLLKWLVLAGYMGVEQHEVKEAQAFTSFSSLVGFLVVFRTSQAYTRFWSGCTSTHQMRAEWFDACSQLMAFCRVSKANREQVAAFQGRIVRLFSMLHAAALAELEEINQDVDHLEEVHAFQYKLIDPHGLDESALRRLKNSASKVELVFTWIQLLLVENIDNGVLSITPAVLSRSFQVLSSGMVAFFDAIKITYSPFPFPYAQTCDFLLFIHWCMCPVVLAQWVEHPAWAGVYTFMQVFILWSLNFIACEIENPFGTDANDLDGWSMQEEMNCHLLLLMNKETLEIPVLTDSALSLLGEEDRAVICESSLMDVWEALASDGEPIPEPARKGKTFSGSAGVQFKALPSLRKSQAAQARKSRMPSRRQVEALASAASSARNSSRVQAGPSVGFVPSIQEEAAAESSEVAPLPPEAQSQRQGSCASALSGAGAGREPAREGRSGGAPEGGAQDVRQEPVEETAQQSRWSGAPQRQPPDPPPPEAAAGTSSSAWQQSQQADSAPGSGRTEKPQSAQSSEGRAEPEARGPVAQPHPPGSAFSDLCHSRI